MRYRSTAIELFIDIRVVKTKYVEIILVENEVRNCYLNIREFITNYKKQMIINRIKL